MDVFIDIETIPGQDSLESYLEDARENFRAPSGLTKEQAAKDLGITEAKTIKFTSKDQMLADWVEAFRDTKADEVAEQNWRKEGLDGGKGEVICLAFVVSGKTYSYSRSLVESDYGLLASAFEDLAALTNGRPAFFIGHNIRFDLKFLYRRHVVLDLPPALRLPFSGRHGKDYYCTMEAWCGYGEKISQDALAAILGLPQKPDGIDGSKVWDFVKAGKIDEVAEYNRYDAETVEAIYRRQTFLPSA